MRWSEWRTQTHVIYAVNSKHILAYRPIAKRWLCKQRPMLGNARSIHARNKTGTVLPVGPCREGKILELSSTPCGGGFEYLHRSRRSRNMRRKENQMTGSISEPPCSWRISWIWDSKIRSWVPWDSDPRMTALERTSRNCKRQPHHFVREDVT
jgi:hypothetical protein